MMSYSLQDFLLFSADTWFFLYLEFAREYWFLPLIVCSTLSTSLVVPQERLQYATMFVLLLSVVWFYLGFYMQINTFAIYLTGLVVFQAGLYGFWIWRRQVPSFLPDSGCNEPLVYWKLRTATVVFILSVVVLIFAPFFTSIEERTTIFNLFLPGWKGLTGALCFVGFTCYYQKIPALYLTPIFLVLIIELLTLKVMHVSYWWVGVAALLAACLHRR